MHKLNRIVFLLGFSFLGTHLSLASSVALIKGATQLTCQKEASEVDFEGLKATLAGDGSDLRPSPGVDRIKCVGKCEKKKKESDKKAEDEVEKEYDDCYNEYRAAMSEVCPQLPNEHVFDWFNRCDALYPSIREARGECTNSASLKRRKQLDQNTKDRDACLAKCKTDFPKVASSQIQAIASVLKDVGLSDEEIRTFIDAVTEPQTGCQASSGTDIQALTTPAVKVQKAGVVSAQ